MAYQETRLDGATSNAELTPHNQTGNAREILAERHDETLTGNNIAAAQASECYRGSSVSAGHAEVRLLVAPSA